jgi:hypothetical protein
MKYTFSAKIYKTGINWCVDVPTDVTAKLTADQGRINIKGNINGFDFTKTLMPVKDAAHRLFVNQAMMKGGKTALSKTATFVIEPNSEKTVKTYPTPSLLTDKLKEHQLTRAFDILTASRKKDILKYLNSIKTEKTLLKNIDKLITQLKDNEKNLRIP